MRPPVTIDAGSLTRCRHRLYLDTAYGSLLAGAGEDPGVTQRREAAAEHRAKVGSLLVAADPDRWIVVDSARPRRERIEATLRACSAGASYVWGATLADDAAAGRRARIDGLIADPDGGYIPLLVVNHKVTDPGAGAVTSPLGRWLPALDPERKVRAQLRDQLALIHVHRVLEVAGHAGRSQRGAVIGFGGDCILVHDLTAAVEEYELRFADRVAVAQGRAVTVPSRVSECRSCVWRSDCTSVLAGMRDVSLVAPGGRADALRESGIRSIDELARWAGEPPSTWPHGDFSEAVIAARAWIDDLPLVRKTRDPQVRRADVEIDVDMESFQEYGAYMWGTLTDLGNGEPARYRAFVTWEPLPTVDEARSFAEFWTWLMDQRDRAHRDGRTFAAYCYSRAAEDKWLLDSARRFEGTPGIPSEDEIRTFIDSDEWVDMYIAVSENFVCPSGKGLKKVAPVAGFTWRDPEAGGEASMGWYREAVGYDREPVLDQRTRLLEYNEDDVQATRALRVWMDSPAVLTIPHRDALLPHSR